MASFEKYKQITRTHLLKDWPKNAPAGLEGFTLESTRRCLDEADSAETMAEADLPAIVVALRNEKRSAIQAGFENFKKIGRFLLELQQITPEAEFWDRVASFESPIPREYAEAAIDAALEAE